MMHPAAGPDERADIRADGHSVSVVVRRLGGLAPLDSAALVALGALSGFQRHRSGTEIISERDAAPKPSFLLHGWAARVRMLPDGRRQIFGFILPGDAIGVCSRPHPLALTSTVCLTPVETIAARGLDKLDADRVPASLAAALHVSASLHEVYLLNQVMRLGRLTAYERTCHLFLELRDRLKLTGLATDQRMPLPLTQETLADVNGLSTVHVNRVLQQLRRDRLLKIGSGEVVLLDPEAMAAAGNYLAPQPSKWR